MTSFIDRLVYAVLRCEVADGDMRRLATRAIADTICVAAPGAFEPVMRNTLAAYGGGAATTWSGEGCESLEAAVLINAVAAHALDFDDVYLVSLAHASAVIVPAIASEPLETCAPDDVIAAFCAGMIAARAVGQRLGQGHYNKGWHGTGTVGAFAAAASVGRLMKVTPDQLKSAFALCGSMSGGLRINFGTQAKPVHAGFAAVAGLRAVRLAQAGVTGAPDVFGRNGFIDLYGGADGVDMPEDAAFVAHPGDVSVKLYPCCYAAHRLIGVALDARERLGAEFARRDDVHFRVTLPAGSVEVLKYDRPATGLEAKFSGPFNVAVAILDGVPTLQSYAAETVQRSDIASVMRRLTIVEDPGQPSGGDIEFGMVALEISGSTVERFERAAIPGSPDDPPAPEALHQKLRGCLRDFEERAGKPFPALSYLRRLGAEGWIFGLT
ncbi:MAG TPA: MmgE/PrpD family protein [Pseudolabrys sp.]|nr:MmgE/PrpD family protein [Pseudolabrys sp.]